MVPLAVESPRTECVVAATATAKTEHSGEASGVFAASLASFVLAAAAASPGKDGTGQTIIGSKDVKASNEMKIGSETTDSSAIKSGSETKVSKKNEAVATSSLNVGRVESLAEKGLLEAEQCEVVAESAAPVKSSVGTSAAVAVKPESAVGSVEPIATPILVEGKMPVEGKRPLSEKAKPEVEQSLKPKDGPGTKASKAVAQVDGSPSGVQEIAVPQMETGSTAVAMMVARPEGAAVPIQVQAESVESSGEINKAPDKTNRTSLAGEVRVGSAVGVTTMVKTAKSAEGRAIAMPSTDDGRRSDKALGEDGKLRLTRVDDIVAGSGKHDLDPVSGVLGTHDPSSAVSTEGTSLQVGGAARWPEHPDSSSTMSRAVEVSSFADGSSGRSDAGAASAVDSGRNEVQGFTAVAPGVLEVGVSNGTHGWLRVRAELQDGAVTASVASATVAGREMLHRELPALTAYLRDERLQVSALVVKDGGMDGLRDNPGGGGMARQPESNSGGSRREEQTAQMPGQGGAEDGFAGTSARSWKGWSGMEFLPAMAVGSGGWLNVRV